MNLLKGKGAVVTGAASGIGKAIATAFIEAGASVLLCDRNADALDTAARELGERALGRVTDVSVESQVEAAMRAARETFGSLDIVVTARALRHCAADGASYKWRSVRRDVWLSSTAEARRPADAEQTPRGHHQHLSVKRRPAGRRAFAYVRRGERQMTRGAWARQPRDPQCRTRQAWWRPR